MRVEAFSPAHITGFFEIHDEHKDPLYMGSKGAGFSITQGVTTRVSIENYHKPSYEIRINGYPVKSACVSEQVLRSFLKFVKENYRIIVDHRIDVPIGGGFGSSGAGGLSLALALNEALGLGLSKVEAAQIAHIVEVKCKTGLGTVIAELYGGLEARLKPGAPGIGELRKISVNGDYSVVCLNFGSISTKKVLSDPIYRAKINGMGGRLLHEFLAHQSIENFLKLSRKFTDHVDMVTDKVRRVLQDADSRGFTCGMMMFGEGVFSIVNNDVKDLLKIFHKYLDANGRVIVTKIDHEGARLL
ncbi:MAG: GHMP kinase [Nitrososphaerota archaeon]|nr:GHMP kinase [Nitrososphaerota archaeon]